MKSGKDWIKKLFWEFPLLDSQDKEKLYYFIKKRIRKHSVGGHVGEDLSTKYISDILSVQLPSNDFRELSEEEYAYQKGDIKLLTYYLPQFYPTPYNDAWWGRGATEWRNVSKSVPQYVGHYQPRLPGELGFYDLRLIDNIKRQVELAKLSGVFGFCYYYYWFNGTRLLDVPVDRFFESKIDFPFCFCWVNENWTRQWFGTSDVPLIKLDETEETYCEFIHGIAKYLTDDRYLSINGAKVLSVYKPKSIPHMERVLEYWRKYIKEKCGCDLYLIAVMNDTYDEFRKIDFVNKGFNAVSEFFLGPQRKYLTDIQEKKSFVCKEFLGNIYDYREFVENKKYFSDSLIKGYRAIAPTWDNTARKINKGFILDGSTPELYQTWLEDIGRETKKRVRTGELDDSLIFINAWNEWAEGAYLEPDMKFGYAYLNATKQAVLKVRNEEESGE